MMMCVLPSPTPPPTHPPTLPPGALGSTSSLRLISPPLYPPALHLHLPPHPPNPPTQPNSPPPHPPPPPHLVH